MGRVVAEAKRAEDFAAMRLKAPVVAPAAAPPRRRASAGTRKWSAKSRGPSRSLAGKRRTVSTRGDWTVHSWPGPA